MLIANHDTFHAVVSLALSPNGGLIAAIGNDEELEIFAPKGGEVVIPHYAPVLAGEDLMGSSGAGNIEMAKDGMTRLAW